MDIKQLCLLLTLSILVKSQKIISPDNVYNSSQIQTLAKNSVKNFNVEDLFLVKMLDASAKIPSGLLDGNFFDLGNFDECYDLYQNGIYGQYCLGTLPFTAATDLLGMDADEMIKNRTTVTIHPTDKTLPSSAGWVLAICIPSSLKPGDIPGIIEFSEELCYSRSNQNIFSTGTIITIIFLLVIISSTVYDILLRYQEVTVSPPHELLTAFSFLSNGAKLFKTARNPAQLDCLNGIRAISMMWVIFCHEYVTSMNGPVSNMKDVNQWMNNAGTMFVKGGTVSVDSFFVTAGLVTAYTFLSAHAKGVRFNIPMFYLHRYLRLTPALGMMMLLHLFLANHLGNGPFWMVVDWTLVQTCRKAWWNTLLYITNYTPKQSCVPQTWYLSVDTQLFFLSPLALIPLVKWPIICLGFLTFLAVSGAVVPFIIGYINNLNMIDGDTGNMYMEQYYIQTYTRFAPYVIGIICGYYIFKIKTHQVKFRLKLWVVYLGWLLILAGLLACLYAGNSVFVTTKDKLSNGLYLGLNRPAWAVALCGVIILCVSGNGGPINAFLSLPLFQFLTKISYSMYLAHYIILTMRYSSMRTTFRFSNSYMMYAFWSDFMCTLFISTIWCLSFESPVIILEKYFFGKGMVAQSSNSRKKPEV